MAIRPIVEVPDPRLRQISSPVEEVTDDVRALGGALFCDRRYGKVFTYHNGAPSYYASRGFRGRAGRTTVP